MPIYEYRCRECHQEFEEWQKDYSEQDKNCPVCGNIAERLISNTSFVLKGSGWYVTDYADNSKNTAKEAGNGNGNGKDPASGDTAEAADKDRTSTDAAGADSGSKADTGAKDSAATSSPASAD
jgi:putative FmdB family regulatory protein